jgi:hypothetical protein
VPRQAGQTLRDPAQIFAVSAGLEELLLVR